MGREDTRRWGCRARWIRSRVAQRSRRAGPRTSRMVIRQHLGGVSSPDRGGSFLDK